VTLITGFELEASRRAFPETQRMFPRTPTRRIGSVVNVGWFGTDAYPESGAVAVVRVGGPYDEGRDEELIGEFLLFTCFDGAVPRQVVAYVAGAADVPADLALSRRAYSDLRPLWTDRAWCIVEVTE
jgi:hypothetical protein